MKKYLFAILFSTFFVSAFAQVKTGIGTRDPQQTLHVALPVGTASSSTSVGSTGVFLVTPTVRVEGLNSANNPANPNDPNSLKRVYANQNGELILINGNTEQATISQQFAGDVIPEQEAVAIGLGGVLTKELMSQTFTLTQQSVVYFSATFGALLRETNLVTGPVSVTDGRAKLFGAYFQFSSSTTGISTTATFGNNKKTYANKGSGGIQGDFMLNPRAKLVLNPGTYTVKLYGEMTSSLLGLLFRVKFAGGTAGESFIISAVPTKYQ